VSTCGRYTQKTLSQIQLGGKGALGSERKEKAFPFHLGEEGGGKGRGGQNLSNWGSGKGDHWIETKDHDGVTLKEVGGPINMDKWTAFQDGAGEGSKIGRPRHRGIMERTGS